MDGAWDVPGRRDLDKVYTALRRKGVQFPSPGDCKTLPPPTSMTVSVHAISSIFQAYFAQHYSSPFLSFSKKRERKWEAFDMKDCIYLSCTSLSTTATATTTTTHSTFSVELKPTPNLFLYVVVVAAAAVSRSVAPWTFFLRGVKKLASPSSSPCWRWWWWCWWGVEKVWPPENRRLNSLEGVARKFSLYLVTLSGFRWLKVTCFFAVGLTRNKLIFL